jgi:glycosyltransferase involved in cell wall biosynthesis
MRVLIVLRHFYCPSMPIGGAERQALKLAKKLQENGVSVTVATGLWDWGLPRQEVIQGIPVRRHFTAWGMFNIRGLRKFGEYFYLLSLFLYLIWHCNEYEVIHCQSAMFEAPVAVLAGKLLRRPVVVRAMASGTWGDLKRLREDRSILGTGWMSRKIRDADAVIALNGEVVQELVEIGVAQEKIFFIPNGVEIGPDSCHRDYALDEPVVVTFVGRLHPQKGVNMLLRAFRLTLQEMPDIRWRLKLAGTGELERHLKGLADELAISQQVEFLGHVEDVDTLLDQSDLFVLPSLSEGMSNALLEAMAHGLPCIVRDIPGNNDVIRDGENGVTVKSDDVEGLARAMVRLAADVESRRRLGQQAHQTVKTHYSLAKVTNQYIGLYEGLLDLQSRS